LLREHRRKIQTGFFGEFVRKGGINIFPGDHWDKAAASQRCACHETTASRE
jgi:hypothetical protein